MKLPLSCLVLAILFLTVNSDHVTSPDDDQSADAKLTDEETADLDIDALQPKRPPLTINRQNNDKLRENLLEIIRRRQQAAKSATPEETTTKSQSSTRSRFDRTRTTTTTTAAPTTSEPVGKKSVGGKLSAAGHPSPDRFGRPRLFSFF